MAPSSSSSASPHLPAKAHPAPVVISRSASPRPQSIHGPSLAAPNFLATLSPRKSAALTETSKSLALAEASSSSSTSSTPLASPSISAEDGSKFSLGGSRLIEEAEAANETLQGPKREERPAKLSLRLGSAMDTTLGPVETTEAQQSDRPLDVKVIVANGADEPSQMEAKGIGSSERTSPSHGPEVQIEVTRPSEEGIIGSTKDDAANSPEQSKETETEEAKGSAWSSWTSRAASGSLSFFKQSTSTAAGWGSTLTTNPFRGSGKDREPATTSQAEAGPSRPRSIVESDDDDDAALAKSAADTLRIGAKNEEKRRAAQTRLQQKRDKAKVVSDKRTGGSERGRQVEGSLLPSRLVAEVDSVPESRSSSPTIRGLNTFDYVEELPGACDPPTGETLPERRYFILTQAGKPVFLSHLAARRLEREDAARARLKALRQAERDRAQQRADLPKGSEVRTEKLAQMDEEDNEARAQEEAARKKDEVASDEDEEDSAVQVGVLQALISNYFDKGLAVLESKSIEILQLPKSSSRVVFLMRGPLYLAVTSTWSDGGQIYSDSATVLKAHLEILHAGLISLISESQLKGLFARGHNFDLRRMLEGTDGILSSLVARCQVDFGLILGAGGGGGICLRPTRLDLKLREDLGSCLSLERWENRPLSRVLAGDSGRSSPLNVPDSPNGEHSRSDFLKADLDPSKLRMEFKIPPRPKDLLYILLITADGQLITMLRPRRLSAYPLDLHLLMNTIVGMSRRTQREPGTVNWIPICLPRFAPQGMVQAHISWLHGDPHQHEKRADRQEEEDGSSETAKDSKRKAECALVIVTADRESFDEIGIWRDGVVKALSLPPSPLASLSHSLTQAPISPDSLRLPGLRHFVLKKKDDLQIVWSEWIEPYAGDSLEAVLARDRVRKTYARARELSILGARMGKSGKKTRKGKETLSASEAAKRNRKSTTEEKQPTTTPDGETGADREVRGAETKDVPAAEDAEENSSTTSTSTPKDSASVAEEASPATIPSALLPQANITSHYFRTPHEAFYIEVPPAPTTSHLTGPLVVDPDSASPYEVYLTLSSNVPPATARKIARQVVRWGLGSGAGAGGDAVAVAGERWRLFVSGRGMVF
ncbi:hypothetical protein BCV69DRAFT_282928 [Microstroma glucosiphilum]|uniref:Uncharacterized protein n=1 Tax=Pseudomicrostroma glucosiphilum TaxID=1684307 RepID=A0A316U7A1_9BASI|nr:hypothetical protein BCV69DRAFT_282928 [Pseudomicrostroma glucosiphilum]PWN20708.1 hypothetical protein BCV69DRAFT_282928 [Pseudomicrostroma glucosiphilum]